MVWLEDNDFRKQIKLDLLDKIIDSDTGLLHDAELAALEEMQSYLRVRYDVAAAFRTTGTDRNPLLVMFLVDMLLYHIHSRLNPRQIPQMREVRYDTALKALKMYAEGKLLIDLPRPDLSTADSTEQQGITVISDKRRDNRY